MNGQGIAKVVIVLIVFPVLLSAIFTVVTVPVGFMLTPLFAKAGAWSETLGKVFVGVTFLIALLDRLPCVGAFGLGHKTTMRRRRPHENLSVIFLTLGGRGPSDRSEWRRSGTVAACSLTSACSRRPAGPAAADTAR